MANINLTPDDITRESLRVLHQKLNFCGNIVRDYDSSYAQDGAKIGNALRVRLPIQYNTGTGATIATTTDADSVGSSTTLTVSSRRHVPLRFTTEELTMDIDDFSSRHIQPAMSKLAAMVEADVLSTALLNVAQTIDGTANVGFDDVMNARKRLNDSLAPMDSRTALMDTQGMVDLVVDNKSLFQDQSQLSMQYKEGHMGRFAGFDFYENTLLPKHTVGAAGADTDYTVNGDNQEMTFSATSNDPTTDTLVVADGAAAVKNGDRFTIAGVYDVHHETKDSTGVLKEFTIISGEATGAATWTIAPAMIADGPHKNISAEPADDAVITIVGVAGAVQNQSLLFQKGFAAFATADLYLPKGTDMASRQVFDGLSLRLVRDYAVISDKVFTRLDILYGFKVLRPELAVRVRHT